MLSISQPAKTGHQRHERIVVQVKQGGPHHSSLRISPPEQPLIIRGCSLLPDTLPPGMLLLRHRDRFDVIGVAMYKGDWGGLLYIDTDHMLIQKSLIFVVR